MTGSRLTFIASPTVCVVLNLMSSGGLAGPASGPCRSGQGRQDTVMNTPSCPVGAQALACHATALRDRDIG